MKIPLQLEIILPCTIALINIIIYVIIYLRKPWLIDIKLNTNWIDIGTIIHMYKPVPCIWNTKFGGVRNEIPPVSVNPNGVNLVELLLVIKSKVPLTQTPPCKLYIRQFCHTETSGCCLQHTNENQSTLLQLIT